MARRFSGDARVESVLQVCSIVMLVVAMPLLVACSDEKEGSDDAGAGLPMSDDFSDEGSGWSTNPAENATAVVVDYEQGGLLLKSNTSSERPTSELVFGREVDSLALQVDAHLATEPAPEIYFGLACLGPPEEAGFYRDFYSFLIDAEGQPAVQEPPDDNTTLTDGVRAIGRKVAGFDPGRVHRLSLDCSSGGEGTEMSFSVDNQHVADLSVSRDAGPYEGAALVLVSAGQTSGSEAVFDNFSASEQ